MATKRHYNCKIKYLRNPAFHIRMPITKTKGKETTRTKNFKKEAGSSGSDLGAK
jgi:hypothetical protein